MADNYFYKTKQDYVYAHLHSAIVNGDFHPGDHLRLDELAEQLGTSRTPLREAVRRLQTEGLVTIAPHRGVIIAGFSIEELAELYHIRSVLDGLAVRLAVPQLTAEDIEFLRSTLETMERGVGVLPAEEINAHNWQFHHVLYQRADSPILYGMITNLYAKTQRYRVFSFRNQERNVQIAIEHRHLFSALEARDPAAAEQRAVAHLENTAKALIALTEQHGREIPVPPRRQVAGDVQERNPLASSAVSGTPGLGGLAF